MTRTDHTLSPTASLRTLDRAAGATSRRRFLLTAALAALPLALGCGGVEPEIEGAASADDVAWQEAALTPSQMWIGAAVTQPESTVSTFLGASSTFGPWRVRRSFNKNLPDHISKSAAADDAAKGVISFLSVKPPTIDGVADGLYDAQIRSLAASFPKDHTTYLTMYHEPENDMSGARFVRMFRHFYQVVKAANPKIKVGTVHMSYQWRPSTDPNLPTRTPDSWWVGSAYTDFIGVDDYNNATSSGRTSAETDPQFQRWYGWAKTKGKPLAVVEFGRFEDPKDPSARARDLLKTESYLRSQGFFMFLYWHGLGESSDGDVWDYRLTSGPARTAMQDISSRGRTGW